VRPPARHSAVQWPDGLIATYLVGVDQSAREEIAAATAAHRELGPGYDEAVAEGLVERIGAAIDKRVDAKLAQRGDGPAERAPGSKVSPAVRPSWTVIILGLGSMAIGGLTAVSLLNAGASTALVVVIWIIIGVINVAYAQRR
jgi:hypothetical protein